MVDRFNGLADDRAAGYVYVQLKFLHNLLVVVHYHLDNFRIFSQAEQGTPGLGWATVHICIPDRHVPAVSRKNSTVGNKYAHLAVWTAPAISSIRTYPGWPGNFDLGTMVAGKELERHSHFPRATRTCPARPLSVCATSDLYRHDVDGRRHGHSIGQPCRPAVVGHLLSGTLVEAEARRSIADETFPGDIPRLYVTHKGAHTIYFLGHGHIFTAA